MESNKIYSKIIKLESLRPDDTYVYVNPGDVFSGYYLEEPEIGQTFTFRCISGKLTGNGDFYTSVVQEIIDERTFKTKNSIYKIVTLADERDEKIQIILK